MPRFVPSVLIADCWGSMGDLTFYHSGGQCYYKNKSRCVFPGTAGQLTQLDVHRRALAAWRSVPHQEQNKWNELAQPVISHRPPFDDTAHISGQNLFVSAFHGFYTLGNEHAPVPQAYEPFPVYAAEFATSAVVNIDILQLNFRVWFEDCPSPERYHMLFKIQLTKPGGGKNPGKMRNFLALAPCTSGDSTVSVLIPGFRDIWGLDLNEYQAHCRYLLLDRQTGYRNQYTPLSFEISV